MLELENPKSIHLNALEPHTWFLPYANPDSKTPNYPNNSERVLSLNGDWQFSMHRSPISALDMNEKPIVSSETRTIKVPGCWELMGYDAPQYLNFRYPFPVDPPNIPDENPTGVYQRNISLPESWSDKRIILTFLGVSSAFQVFLDGQFVGANKGSHLTTEFDLTPLLNAANSHQLTVIVYKWSDCSYLEDQDMWRFHGIFRDVYLTARPEHYLHDIRISAELDYRNNSGKFSLEFITNQSTPLPIHVSLYDPKGIAVFSRPPNLQCLL